MLQNSRETLKRLKDKAKSAISKSGKIIFIPKDQMKIACTNTDYHGKMHSAICFRPGVFGPNGKIIRRPVDEVECDCGIIYKQEK